LQGPLVLPELRSPTGATRRRSPILLSGAGHITKRSWNGPGVWGSLGAVAVGASLGVVAARSLHRRAVPVGHIDRPWFWAAIAGAVAQIAVFLALPVDPGYLEPVVPLVWLILGLTLGVRAVVAVVAAVAVSSFVAPSASPAFGRTVLRDAQERRAGLDYVEEVTRAVSQLPPGSVVVTGSALPQLQAEQPRSLLVAPELGGPERSVQIPERVVLPGGQILAYRPIDIRSAPVAYRLSAGRADLPLLPLN